MSQNSSGFPTGKETVITFVKILDSRNDLGECISFERGKDGVKELAIRQTADMPPKLMLQVECENGEKIDILGFSQFYVLKTELPASIASRLLS